jgi:sugar lactone lactonase YvrE
MKIRLLLATLFVLLSLFTACTTGTTPVPATEKPDTVTQEPVTKTTDTPVPTHTPTSTSEPQPEEEATPTPEPTQIPDYIGFRLMNAGFSTPESVCYDPEADVYLVTNINGSPGAKDGNGFISRVSPDGEIIELKWIDGAADGVTLHAPKGMVLTSAGLYVADIDAVRLFDRETGEPQDAYPIKGASFLNDVTADESEVIYVSDSGLGSVHSITPDGTVSDIMLPGSIEGPNGLAVWDGAVYVTSGNGVFVIEGDLIAQIFSVPKGSLDGLVFLDGDNILVSSWSAKAVYHASKDADAVEVASSVQSPADIGFDPVRGYILIPLFEGNGLDVRPLP